MRIHPLVFVSHGQRLAMRHNPARLLPTFVIGTLGGPTKFCSKQQICVRETDWSPAGVAEWEQVALAPETGATEEIWVTLKRCIQLV